jgi:aryl-alcohol dehydrogenase-like predicted oxidoreductase
LTVGGTVKGPFFLILRPNEPPELTLSAGDPVKDIIQTALDNGVNFFDNAEVYSNGQSEIEMGRVFKELEVDRSQLVISTKVRRRFLHIALSALNVVTTVLTLRLPQVFFGTGKSDINSRGNSRKHIIEGTKASLARLQLDYVDVILAHRYDVATPIEETVRAFAYIIDKGYAFYWGCVAYLQPL